MKKIVIILIIAIVLGGIGVLGAFWWLQQGSADAKELTREAYTIQDGTQAEGSLDFEALQKVNPHIYAWIHIPGTQVDAPIVQHPDDNTYYLTHGPAGEENSYNAIFTENYNDQLFEDYITGIYGNSAQEGVGFYDLYQYVDKKFMEDHPYLYIYLPDRVLQYRIFAAYVGDNSHVVLNYEKGVDEMAREVYIDSIMEQRSMDAIIDRNTSVDYNSKVITLTTNHKLGNNFRFLVQAYLEQIKK